MGDGRSPRLVHVLSFGMDHVRSLHSASFGSQVIIYRGLVVTHAGPFSFHQYFHSAAKSKEQIATCQSVQCKNFFLIDHHFFLFRGGEIRCRLQDLQTNEILCTID